jgi:hypothetical protein
MKVSQVGAPEPAIRALTSRCTQASAAAASDGGSCFAEKTWMVSSQQEEAIANHLHQKQLRSQAARQCKDASSLEALLASVLPSADNGGTELKHECFQMEH